MDVVHPGWRDELIEARFGRALVVTHDRPRPGTDPADRPTVAVPDVPGVFVAGDWICDAKAYERKYQARKQRFDEQHRAWTARAAKARMLNEIP